MLAALCSLFLPGLGQLLQGRPLSALAWLVMVGLAWAVGIGAFLVAIERLEGGGGFGMLTMLFGPAVHLICIVEAARHNPERK